MPGNVSRFSRELLYFIGRKVYQENQRYKSHLNNSDAEDSSSISSVATLRSSRSLPDRQVYREVQLRFLTEDEKKEQYRVRGDKEPLIRKDADVVNNYNTKKFCFKLFPCCSFCA